MPFTPIPPANDFPRHLPLPEQAASPATAAPPAITTPLPTSLNITPPRKPPPTLRERTTDLMACRTCGRPIYITPSGFLACEDLRCGRLLSPYDQFGFGARITDLRIAWPERSITRDRPIRLPAD